MFGEEWSQNVNQEHEATRGSRTLAARTLLVARPKKRKARGKSVELAIGFACHELDNQFPKRICPRYSCMMMIELCKARCCHCQVRVVALDLVL